MNRFDTPALPLLGRLLLAAIFVTSGLAKLANPSGTIGYIASAGLPVPEAAYAVALFCEVGCGIALVLGLFTPIVAAILAVFTLVTGFAFHYHPADMGQMINFWKNVAITGGFLFVMAHGAGAWSLDAILARRRAVAVA